MTRHLERLLAVIALTGAAVFIALTVVVTSGASFGLDREAFTAAHDLRATWLDDVAKVITQLGLIVFVGPAVLLAAALLLRVHRRARALALVIGAGLAWAAVWVTKVAVDRPRPPAPLVHTVGQSFPSGHAGNSVGWFALAVALTAIVGRRSARVTILVTAALFTLLIGVSRIYLRAHYASDVIAGEAIALTMYALAVLGVLRASPASGDASGAPHDQLAA